jgi:hypothetical protein
MAKTYKVGDMVPCSGCGEPIKVFHEGDFLVAYHACTKKGNQQMFRAPATTEPEIASKPGRPEEGVR